MAARGDLARGWPVPSEASGKRVQSLGAPSRFEEQACSWGHLLRCLETESACWLGLRLGHGGCGAVSACPHRGRWNDERPPRIAALQFMRYQVLSQAELRKLRWLFSDSYYSTAQDLIFVEVWILKLIHSLYNWPFRASIAEGHTPTT